MTTMNDSPEARVQAAACRLNASDIAELRECTRRGYVTPRFSPKNGRMLAAQWRSWKKLQLLGCGSIEGSGEAEDFAINHFGRQVLKAC